MVSSDLWDSEVLGSQARTRGCGCPASSHRPSGRPHSSFCPLAPTPRLRTPPQARGLQPLSYGTRLLLSGAPTTFCEALITSFKKSGRRAPLE